MDSGVTRVSGTQTGGPPWPPPPLQWHHWLDWLGTSKLANVRLTITDFIQAKRESIPYLTSCEQCALSHRWEGEKSHFCTKFRMAGWSPRGTKRCLVRTKEGPGKRGVPPFPLLKCLDYVLAPVPMVMLCTTSGIEHSPDHGVNTIIERKMSTLFPAFWPLWNSGAWMRTLVVPVGLIRWLNIQKETAKTLLVMSVPRFCFQLYLRGKHGKSCYINKKWSWKALEQPELVAAKQTRLTYCLLPFTAFCRSLGSLLSLTYSSFMKTP